MQLVSPTFSNASFHFHITTLLKAIAMAMADQTGHGRPSNHNPTKANQTGHGHVTLISFFNLGGHRKS